MCVKRAMENPRTAFLQALFHISPCNCCWRFSLPKNHEGCEARNAQFKCLTISALSFSPHKFLLRPFCCLADQKMPRRKKVSIHAEGAFVRGLSNGSNSIIHATVVVSSATTPSYGYGLSLCGFSVFGSFRQSLTHDCSLDLRNFNEILNFFKTKC